MERREFLNWVGTGAIASFLPVAIAACGSNQDSGPSSTGATDSTTTANASADASADGRINMGSATDLNNNGFLYSKENNIIVVKTEDGGLSALNPKCTHQQCPVEWDAEAANLYCPCHGSAFATDGSVLAAPATAPLASYADVTEEGGNILVTVS